MSASINSIEDQRLLEEVLREMDLQAAIDAAPVKVVQNQSASRLDREEWAGGITFQQCGGGRRVIRKKISGS